jgi:hypothetical protein
MYTLNKLRIAKMVLTLCVSIFCFFLHAHSQMRKMSVGNTADENDIRKLSFFSPSEGYVAFNQNLGYTTDSGKTFIKKFITASNVNFNGYSVNLTFGFQINGVIAFNKDTLLAYGNYGLVPAILYSVDGAGSFKLVYHSQYNSKFREGFTDMVFPSNNGRGYAVDADRVIATDDRGKTWIYKFADSPDGGFTTLIGAGDNFIVFGPGSTAEEMRLALFTGFGMKSILMPAGTLSDAFFLTTNKGWINLTGIIYYTSNGGTTWTKMNNGTTAISSGRMKFINDSTGYALSGPYEVYKTTDSGKIWEPLPRDNQYNYLDYGHKDLQLMGNQQLWAGGSLGLLEMSNNAGGIAKPKSYFVIDTVNLYADNTIKLINYSKRNDQYEWFRNDTLIGTSYQLTYTRNIYKLLDTIKLVTHKGSVTDTSVKYQEFYPPVIVSSFTPAAAAPGKTVTIHGARFTGAYSVTFGGVRASFSVVNDSTITAITGSGASGEVTVWAPYGRGSLAGFTLIPPPVILDFTPMTVTAGAVITIHGQHLLETMSVSFGGVSAVSFTVISDDVVTAVTGIAATGDVSLTTNAGTATLGGFKMLPVMSSFVPAGGTYGEVISITGTGFTGTTQVTIGGVPVTSFQVDSANHITAVAGAGSSGPVNVITTAGNSSLPGFTYVNPPVITGMTPSSAAIGATVTLTGSNFSTDPLANVVYFGGVKAQVLTANTNTLTVSVPYGATYKPVTVTTNHLTAYTQKPFHVTFADGGSINAGSLAARADINFYAIFGQSNPYDLVIGDIDGDLKPDVALIDYYGTRILRNTTTGDSITMADPITINAGRNPLRIKMADIDGDGIPDLGIYDADKGGVLIYRNTSVPGTISFTDSLSLPGQNVVFTDVDKDGKTDLITGTYVYRNTSYPGHLSFAKPYTVSISGPIESICDLDMDGRPDVLSYSIVDDKISVARNISVKGTIAFSAGQNYTTHYPYGIATADIDNDGYPDVVATDAEGESISVFRNISKSGSISLAPKTDLQAGGTPEGPAFNDIDGDGKLDLVYVNTSYNDTESKLTLYKNLSTPGNIKFADRISVPGSYGLQRLDAGDLNMDGRPDIVTVSQSHVSFFKNTVTPAPFIREFTPSVAEQGTTITIKGNNFSNTGNVTLGGVNAASFIIISDSVITAVAGTGAAGDVAVTNAYGRSVKKGFSYGLPPVIVSFSPGSGPVGTIVTITGNHFATTDNIVYLGKIKVEVLSATPASLTVKVPAGITYAPVTVTSNNLSAYSTEQFIVTFPVENEVFTASSFGPRIDIPTGSIFSTHADLNNDGKTDFLFSGVGGGLGILQNTSVPGAITFAAVKSFPTADNPNRMTTGDLDGDGRIDAIITNFNTTSLTILRNTSTGSAITFADKQVLPMPHAISAVGAFVADLDNDGKPELVLSNYNDVSLNVLRNLSTPGNIAFDINLNYFLGFVPGSVALTDYDGDGKIDIAVAAYLRNSIKIFRNTSIAGSISFADPLIIEIQPDNTSINSLATSDINNDGKPDLVASSILLLNKSSTGRIDFAAPVHLPADYYASYVSVNDMDGDGKPDLITDNLGPNKISLLKNTSSKDAVSFATKVEYDFTGMDFGLITGATADIDGDGKPEMIVFQGGNTSIFPNQVMNRTVVKVCSNTDTTLTSTTSGTTYQWQLNTGSGFTNISGSNTASLQIKSIQHTWNNYQYSCLVDGVMKDAYILSLKDSLIPDVRVTANVDSICTGSAVTFTAIPVNGGTNPAYQWLLNGANTGIQDKTYTTSTLRSNDQVSVMMTSNAACVIKNTDTSAVKRIDLLSLVPVLTYADSTLRVSSYNYGATFVWQLKDQANSWQQVVSAAGPSYKPKENGTYRVIVNQSICSWTSDEWKISVNATPNDTIPAINTGVHIFPNPASTTITIDDLKLSDKWEIMEIRSMDGSRQIDVYNIAGQTKITVSIAKLNNGFYLAVLKRKNGSPAMVRFIKL